MLGQFYQNYTVLMCDYALTDYLDLITISVKILINIAGWTSSRSPVS